jgi:hypothetical protein
MRCIFTTSNYCVRFYSTTLEVGWGYGVTPKSGVTYRVEFLGQPTRITVVGGDNRVYILEGERDILCLGFGVALLLVLVPVLVLLFLLLG